MIAAAMVVTSLILVTLLWAQWRRWQEKKRRGAGITALAVGDGHTFISGCLGVAGYMGLLFIIVWFTIDIVEEAVLPAWLNWVAAFGLVVGFFAFVYWTIIGVGASFALTRLVLGPQGIRLVRLGKTIITIRWDEPWQLEQFADIHLRYRYLGERYTDYRLWFHLQQQNRRLILQFDVDDQRVGGLPPYDGMEEGLRGFEMAEWLQDEISYRFKLEQGSDVVTKSPEVTVDVKQQPERRASGAPDLALMKALGFTGEDLAFNRDGAYKASQVAYLRRDGWLTLATYIVMALIFGGLAVRQVVQMVGGESSETTVAAFVVFLLVFGFCTLMAFVSYADIRVDIHITRIQGTVTLQHYEQSGEYWLRVNDTAVPITGPVYDAFENQTVYDLYFVYHGVSDTDKTLVSAEKA
jgi:hypothetical protein